jgi:hypothetical protein
MEFVVETSREEATVAADAVAKAKPEGSPQGSLQGDSGCACPGETFLVERVRGGFFKPTIYSIRPILHAEDHAEAPADAASPEAAATPTEAPNQQQHRMWARMHFGQKSHYSISGDIEDLSKPRKKRGDKFVGKIQIDHAERVYRGWTQTTHDDTRSQLVTVVYDHERMASVDFKMEVGLPVVPTPSFHDDFMLIYRDGTQNLQKTDQILVLVQGDDSHNMATDESLKLLKGTAAVVSTKNFNLIKAKPIRGSRYAEGTTGATEETTKATAVSAVADASSDTDQAFMYFGKLSEDKFCCRFRQPIDMATAFMIILSRFDTTQKYE